MRMLLAVAPRPRLPPLVMSASTAPPRPVALAALATYFGYFFLSDVPPGPNVFATGPEFISSVIDLSLNFFFVLPLTQPDLAPVCDPMYEAIFNTAIAFSLLFLGFVTDGRRSNGSNGFAPYLAAMPFATNLAYLAYLGLRPVEDDGSDDSAELTWLEQLGESPALPIALVGMLALSLGWGFLARPEFGPLAERGALLSSLLGTERLAYALTGDCLFFALFQGWLLADDLARREALPDDERARLLLIGRFVPYLGLAYYLLARPPLKR